MLNLAPINRYILYIAIALFLVTMIVFLSKLVTLGKTVKERKPKYNHIKNSVELTKIKADAVKTKVGTIVPVLKKAIVILPIVWAVNKAYKQQEEKGLKAYREAAISAISKKQAISAIEKAVQEIL